MVTEGQQRVDLALVPKKGALFHRSYKQLDDVLVGGKNAQSIVVKGHALDVFRLNVA